MNIFHNLRKVNKNIIHPEVMHLILTLFMSKSTNRLEADQETSNKRL